MKKDKILQELERNKEKIAAVQARNKELEKLKSEAENIEILTILRGFNMSHNQLLEFLKQCRADEIMPVQSPIIKKESDVKNEEIE